MFDQQPLRRTEIVGGLAAFLTAFAGLPMWTIAYLKLTAAYADEFNSASLLVWPGLSIVLALPFAVFVAFLSFVIYANSDQRGWRWYGRAILVNLIGWSAIFLLYAFTATVYGLGGELPSVVLNVVAIPVLCGPMCGPPALAAMLVYAFVALPRE